MPHGFAGRLENMAAHQLLQCKVHPPCWRVSSKVPPPCPIALKTSPSFPPLPPQGFPVTPPDCRVPAAPKFTMAVPHGTPALRAERGALWSLHVTWGRVELRAPCDRGLRRGSTQGAPGRRVMCHVPAWIRRRGEAQGGEEPEHASCGP